MPRNHQLLQYKDTVFDEPPNVSFEFFPPKTTKGSEAVRESLQTLCQFSPEYISVTYGAGGSTREHTFELVKYINSHCKIPPAAHLTCVNATKDEINAIAQGYLDIGVNRIVALRGDPPNLETSYQPHPEGYAYAHELVEGLNTIGNFDISVASFPEVHPEAKNADADLNYLKEKLDAGANRAITQYCFDTDTILRFIERARAKGISKPIVPGIVMINNIKQIISFSQRCGATVPKWLLAFFEGTENSPELHKAAATSVAVEQCRLLAQEGINTFHLYTLNQSDIPQQICQQLGIRANITPTA